MDCALCKNGTIQKGNVTVTLEKGSAIILIKDVPAEVCTNCGHYYLSEEMTKIIMEKGKEAISKGAVFEVMKLQVA
ncbi:type II toxin-antitoxin system MqsA family antitoxin [Pedobacter sp. P351]|uniref:type II toxin-antitoxin system MqsA family antitoxin n=1 Tax=Pedobacter superstes TaxID=3133441 RepID=UPI0030A5B83B